MTNIINKKVINSSYFNADKNPLKTCIIMQDKPVNVIGTAKVELLNKKDEVVRMEKVENAFLNIPLIESSSTFWDNLTNVVDMSLKDKRYLDLVLDGNTREENPNGVNFINTDIKGYAHLSTPYTGVDIRQGSVNQSLSIFNKLENNYNLNRFVVDFNYEKANGTIKDLFLIQQESENMKNFTKVYRRICNIPVDIDNNYIYPSFYKSYKEQGSLGMYYFGTNVTRYTLGLTKKFYLLKIFEGIRKDFSYVEIGGLEQFVEGKFGSTCLNNIPIIFNKDTTEYWTINLEFDSGTKTETDNYVQVDATVTNNKTLDITNIPLDSGDTLILKDLKQDSTFLYALFVGTKSGNLYLAKYTTEGVFVEYAKSADNSIGGRYNPAYLYTEFATISINRDGVFIITCTDADFDNPFEESPYIRQYYKKDNILERPEFYKDIGSHRGIITGFPNQISPNYPIYVDLGKQTFNENVISLNLNYFSFTALSHAKLTNPIEKTNEYTMRITWEIKTYPNSAYALLNDVL